MAQMDELRAKKATKELYSISFESIQSDYNALLKDFEANPDNAGKTFISFNNFLVDSVRTALTYCSKFNYDGIVMAYQGKAKLYMTEEEKVRYMGYENDFIGIATDWVQRNTNRIIFFQGKPQNVIDQIIFPARTKPQSRAWPRPCSWLRQKGYRPASSFQWFR